MRSCGSCGLCCKVTPIRELQKPQGQWCEYWQKGIGCKIHHVQPDACRNFSCLWLSEAIPERLSPRKTGVVAWASKDHQIYLNQDRRADAMKSFAPEIAQWVQRGVNVNVVKA